MQKKSSIGLFLLIAALFFIRLAFGLVSIFWPNDNLQVYLIGLKSFTTGTWPYYGPDVVYTFSHISGALQGLLVSAGFYIYPAPESPVIILNILSFLSLSFFAWYISRRIPTIPRWVIWILVMMLPWTMAYPTQVVNPSYALLFSVPFFVCFFELARVYPDRLLSRKLCYFVLGAPPFLIMQVHLSFALLFPFVLYAFFKDRQAEKSNKKLLVHLLIFICGALIGMSTVIPTWLLHQSAPGTGSNVVFDFGNVKNVFTILLRYFSFASYEIPYFLGAHFHERVDLVKEHIWMAPFIIFLVALGFLQVGLFILFLFKGNMKDDWRKIKWLSLAGYVFVFLSFFFSVKGPSSHTFLIMLPLPLLYSFYCYEYLWQRFKIVRVLLYIALFSGFFFYAGLGIHNYQNYSLYKDRPRIVKALQEKDYRIVGERRYE